MKLFKREKYLKKIRSFYNSDDIIKVITGVRRCGKSSLMQTIADELIENGVSKDNIIYIDLDKRGYRKVKTADQLENLIENQLLKLQLNKKNNGLPHHQKMARNDDYTNKEFSDLDVVQITSDGLKYLFIDEIQNVTGFEEVINGFRSEGNISIFITGSNSYLLSGELVTKLTGRYLEFELFTLSFDEYINIKKFYKKEINSNLIIELNNYILEGGFPRTIQLEDLSAKRLYVENVVKEIFQKDIKKRTKIKDLASFERVRDYIINNFGATTSISSLCEALHKNGIIISRLTLSRYIQVLVDAKILYDCNRFDIKSKRSLSGDKKYYLSDLSFYYAINTDNRINYGPNLENIVYIYARSLGYSISVGRFGKLECDFILRNNEMDYFYVQVAYTIALSKETEDREFRALETIKDNYAKYVMTTDYLLQKRNGIKHVNIMDFMVKGLFF